MVKCYTYRAEPDEMHKTFEVLNNFLKLYPDATVFSVIIQNEMRPLLTIYYVE